MMGVGSIILLLLIPLIIILTLICMTKILPSIPLFVQMGEKKRSKRSELNSEPTAHSPVTNNGHCHNLNYNPAWSSLGELRPSPSRKTQVPALYLRESVKNYWTAIKVTFFVNGDEHFPGLEYRFRPGKDMRDLDALFDMLTKRLPQLVTGARYLFTIQGEPVHRIEQLQDQAYYVVSSNRKFKVR